MPDLLTAIETWLKTLFTKWLAEAMPQIREAAAEVATQTLNQDAIEKAIDDLDLDSKIHEIVDQKWDDDIDAAIRTFIRSNVEISIDC